METLYVLVIMSALIMWSVFLHFNRFFLIIAAGCPRDTARSDAGQLQELIFLSSSIWVALYLRRRSQCNLFIIIIYYSFLKDFQPHPDIDAGAHHGQFNLSSDQEMWPELHVRAAKHRQETLQPTHIEQKRNLHSLHVTLALKCDPYPCIYSKE